MGSSYDFVWGYWKVRLQVSKPETLVNLKEKLNREIIEVKFGKFEGAML